MIETCLTEPVRASSTGPMPAINPPVRRFVATVRDACVGLPGWWQYQRKNPLTIVVLGMHRSGTSCITRMVNLCGASLGGSTVGANASNQRGHWESEEGLSLNELILRYSGGSWDNPPRELRTAPFIKVKMRGFLGRLHRAGTAVWKDPRTVVTFPLWRPMLRRLADDCGLKYDPSILESCARELRTSDDRESPLKPEIVDVYVAFQQRIDCPVAARAG